ncbi:MAG: serine protease, partial [Spirochaetota bacterium]
MGYIERKNLYKELEESRKSKVIVYVTGDRRGWETKIHQEVLNYFITILDKIDKSDKISLYLYTRGGDTLAAWSIVNLI